MGAGLKPTPDELRAIAETVRAQGETMAEMAAHTEQVISRAGAVLENARRVRDGIAARRARFGHPHP
jgi:hypothetical protein